MQLWNAHTGTLKKVIKGGWSKKWSSPEDPILALAFPQNGNKIIRRTAYTKSVRGVHPDDGSNGGQTYIDARYGKSNLGPGNSYISYTKISALLLSSNGETFATAEVPATVWARTGEIEIGDVINVHLWTGDKKGPEISTNHKDLVNVLALSYKGDFLATGSADKTIQLIDIKEPKLLRTLDKHTSEVTALAYAKDGTLASGSKDGTVLIWENPMSK